VGEPTRQSRGEAVARASIYNQQYNKQTRVRHLSNAIIPNFWFEETDSRVEKRERPRDKRDVSKDSNETDVRRHQLNKRQHAINKSSNK
jgi:hypothetical protein